VKTFIEQARAAAAPGRRHALRLGRRRLLIEEFWHDEPLRKMGEAMSLMAQPSPVALASSVDDSYQTLVLPGELEAAFIDAWADPTFRAS
jgi:hypothetical protein